MPASSLKEKIRSLFGRTWEGEKKVHGLKGGSRAYFLSVLAREIERPILILTPGIPEAEEMLHDLCFFFGEETGSSYPHKRIFLFPSWEILPFEKLSPHPDTLASRMESLHALLARKSPILISTPSALMQRIIPKDTLKESRIDLAVGQEFSRDALIDYLSRWGYQNVPLAEERGDFSVRGGIVDIFAPGYGRPLRLEFLGDKLDSIREYDPSTQRSRARHRELFLLPIKEFSVRSEKTKVAVREIRNRADELDMERKERNSMIQSLEDGIPFAGMEFLVPYFYPELSTAFAYLPPDTLIWLDQAAQVEAEVERFERFLWQRATKSQQEGRFAPRIESLYLSADEWKTALAPRAQVHSESLDVFPPKAKPPDNFLSVRSYLLTDLRREVSRTETKEPSLAPLIARLKGWGEERLFFVAPSKGDALRLRELLAHYEVQISFVEGCLGSTISRETPHRAIVVGELSQGFRLPEEELILITSDEIFGTKKRRRAIPKGTYPSRFISSLSELKQDDPVVHLEYGIGIYRGLKFLKAAGVEGEFLHLEYSGGDRLYLPVDRINLVQKYAGGEGAIPPLDKLGGTSWEKVKAKTRKAVIAMAKELIGIHAAREVHGGHGFPPPDLFYREFEASFEFEETPDQERAIEETLADMQRKIPMDRLICGDVGYGKTEVAIRGAFLAVMDGKQAAVLVPTTVLAQQHFQTFSRRFRGYPVRVEMLSRFLTPKENQKVIRDLSRGLVDIVIGTHRLLQKDVEFKDLGLVVIDEEHRFGVVHKEKLKKLRSQVDVMSLTATPIPRTLHMSLVGIRDMSVIESPPPDRLAIRTYITRYDEGTIRDSIIREISRGGQVFFLHNRVETIDRIAEKVADLAPDARVSVAHGQMKPSELEKAMLDFLANRTQVLVCSAIIESGLDFPNANTIIINRADRLGLAQLYQLRGRVGRSHHRAYAYLLLPPDGIMTRDAEKRLRALQELDDLGGGFKLSLHDLEIRGAGNLLGKEQSGRIAEVGFELYTRMMEEAVRELRGEKVKVHVDPEIRLGIPAYFPDEYVSDANQRLILYKRLASLTDEKEMDEIREEIRDRYGPIPPEAENLCKVMVLKRHLKEALVQQISYNDGRLSLLFHPDSPVKVERVLEIVNREGNRYRLSPEGRVSFRPENQSWEEMIPEVTGFIVQLCSP